MNQIKIISTVCGSAMLLVSCSNNGFWHTNKLNETDTITDYSATECNLIYQQGNDAKNNPTYWLKLMTCVRLLESIDAQQRLAKLSASTHDWSIVFERSILLNQLKPSDHERRQVQARLNKQCASMPSQICHLVNIWLDGQQNLLQLSTERYRYQRLKDKSEADITQLQNELADLQIKLKQLTDIEHQFSSRHQAQDKNNEKKMGADDKIIPSTNSAVAENKTESQQETLVPGESPPVPKTDASRDIKEL